MYRLAIKQTDNPAGIIDVRSQSSLPDNVDRIPINVEPWPGTAPVPSVSFSIAHFDDGIILRYFVTEKDIRAVNTRHNEPVWQDSCVEFFVSFEDDPSYYNLEFNCLGTGLVGYGPDRHNRGLLPPDVISKIATHSVMHRRGSGTVTWELLLIIPNEVFIHSSITKLHGKKARGNFYKCGDLLPSAHFLSWAPIQSATPNFHLSEWFGELQFG